MTDKHTRERGDLLDQQVVIFLDSILVSSKRLVAEGGAPDASTSIMNGPVSRRVHGDVGSISIVPVPGLAGRIP